jgi:hypothetical protein
MSTLLVPISYSLPDQHSITQLSLESLSAHPNCCLTRRPVVAVGLPRVLAYTEFPATFHQAAGERAHQEARVYAPCRQLARAVACGIYQHLHTSDCSPIICFDLVPVSVTVVQDVHDIHFLHKTGV